MQESFSIFHYNILLRVSGLKKIWLIVVILLCFASIVGGKVYWNHKLNQVRVAANLKAQGDLSGINESSDTSQNAIEKKIAKLPITLRNAATDAYKKSGQVQISLIGSDNVQALALLLQNQLDQVYGESFFKITVQDLGKTNSLALNQAKVENLIQNANGKSDAVIFTPLLYNDDRQVRTEDTETVTTLLEEKVRIKYPKAAFFVSLPNYSSNQPYMNDRIDELNAYLKKQKITVLDYLSNWPKGSKRADLVGEDGHTMNNDGRQVWINYISKQWGLN